MVGIESKIQMLLSSKLWCYCTNSW